MDEEIREEQTLETEKKETAGTDRGNSDCYTVQDLCRILKISRPTVYSLLKTRQFSWINIGGRKYRISRRSFDNWLDNQM